MRTIITAKSFKLHEIDAAFIKDFLNDVANAKDLSDFHQAALKWLGDAIRPNKSQHSWTDGCYWWYTDGTQSHEQGVWMTKNGIAMFEDITEKKLYRIEFC